MYHLYEDRFVNFLLSKGDILIAMTGNHIHAKTQIVGDVSMYKLETKSLLNQRVGKIISKNDSNLKFIYYYLKEEEMEVLKNGVLTEADIVKYAEKFNTHPAIIIGRLQKKEIIPYSQGRQFFIKLNFDNSN